MTNIFCLQNPHTHASAKKYIQTKWLEKCIIKKEWKHSPNHDREFKEIIIRNLNMPVLKKIIKNIWFNYMIINYVTTYIQIYICMYEQQFLVRSFLESINKDVEKSNQKIQ